jgi:hypothetical protein
MLRGSQLSNRLRAQHVRQKLDSVVEIGHDDTECSMRLMAAFSGSIRTEEHAELPPDLRSTDTGDLSCVHVLA